MNQPAFRAPAVLLVLLSLSIGWGIRGNYGHEAGAMLPGALAAIAMALVSGREDWRRRIPYMAFFGALGWAFGGSIAYMVPPSYTQSGQLATQVYGFFSTFLEAFLWAGMGGAITAFAAVEEMENVTAIFRPLMWVFAVWGVQYVIQDTPFAFQDRIFAAFGADRSDFRQRDPLYWLDSEWVEAVLALAALAAFDLWDRRFAKAGRLVAMVALGAGVGWGVERLLRGTGLEASLIAALVHPQGDLRLLDPATGNPRFAADDLVTNWPMIFARFGTHLGWIGGALTGAVVYFRRHGAWRSGADLLVWMAVGSLAVFLAGPVLLSNVPWFREAGGFRLAPPRGDSWANILGCYLGFVLHCRKRGRKDLVFAAVLAGALGGFALTTAQFIKVLCVAPGSPALTQDPTVIEAWKHWRSANWHSLVLEQLAGFLYGLAVVVPLGILARRTPMQAESSTPRPWTRLVAVVFVFNVLTYINVVKNVRDWTEPHAVGSGVFQSVADLLHAPLFGSVVLTPWSWFTLMWAGFTVATIRVLRRHRSRPVALIPATWEGKGQLLYLGLLWLMVIANFSKALVAFHESRIGTEGLVMVNALIATLLLLGPANGGPPLRETRATDFGPLVRRSGLLALAILGLSMVVYTAGIRAVYGDQWTAWGGKNLRFGPEADWRLKPILLNKRHN